MITKLSVKDYQIRISVIIFAFLSPLICLIFQGYKPSLSSYWGTDMQPIFIIANATTSFYLYQIKNWELPSFTLLLLTAFSFDIFPLLHNILAGIFFITIIYPLYKSNQYKWALWIYIVSMCMLPFSMLVAEIGAIWTLCTHQFLVLRKLYKISIK